MYRRNFLRITQYTMASALAAGCSIGGKSVTAETAHRPWPMPETRWAMSMRWHDLLFLHWPVHPKLIRPLIPREIDLDTFDGQCWIGIVPFHMSGVRLRYVPISLAFAELNVRTYVKIQDHPGVWFFSLDASSWLAVRAARCMNLPYYDAEMKVEGQGAEVKYRAPGFTVSSLRSSRRTIGRTAAFITPRRAHSITGSRNDIGFTLPSSRRLSYTEISTIASGRCKRPKSRSGKFHDPSDRCRAARYEPACHFACYQEVVAWPVVKLNQL